jgi:AcrR family transcriptional regulator
MAISERAVDRSVASARARATEEVDALIDAALVVLRRGGAEHCTVAEVLREAGLSTRAFYRHFASKDELVLAVYERDATASHARLRAAMTAAPSPKSAVELWVDETLALAFDTRRARRTRVLAHEGARLQHDFAPEFDAIVRGIVDPLAEALANVSEQPDVDARTIHAIAWSFVEAKLRGDTVTRAEARAHILRFCLPALGLTS